MALRLRANWVEMEEGASSMRIAVVLALFAGALTLTPGSASSAPLALGEHASLSRDMSAAAVQISHRRTAYARHYKHYASSAPRRYNWQYYPYWRPYYYHYWQHYYPYGGPLF
jgi:hypothetical protein